MLVTLSVEMDKRQVNARRETMSYRSNSPQAYSLTHLELVFFCKLAVVGFNVFPFGIGVVLEFGGLTIPSPFFLSPEVSGVLSAGVDSDIGELL